MDNADYDEQKPDIKASEGSKPVNIKIDKVIKYLFSSEKQALIRLVNGALGESYDPDTTELIELNTEFIHHRTASDVPETDPFDLDRIIADMMFSLNGVTYHIEFQTKADQTIAIRIIGYGTEYALSKLRNKDVRGGVVFELPVPVLIQIDKDEGLADKIPALIKLSGRTETLKFDITVIKLWTYDVDKLVTRGFYLLLPFILSRHRKRKNTGSGVHALISDIHKIEKAITELYKSGKIFSNLRSDLYAATDSIVRNINARYYGNNLEIDRELKKMETTRALFASEIEAKGVAKGEAKGEAELTKIIKLHLEKKTPKEISKEVGISSKKVTDFLKKSGLMELGQ